MKKEPIQPAQTTPGLRPVVSDLKRWPEKMKYRKILVTSLGFLVVGLMVLAGAGPMFLKNIQTETSAYSSYPNWVYAISWGLLCVGGIHWLLRGIRGLQIYSSPFEEEKQKWLEVFARDEAKLRGGSRRTVIVLGCCAIVIWLIIGLYFRSY